MRWRIEQRAELTGGTFTIVATGNATLARAAIRVARIRIHPA
jgi:hypothetical protein